MDYSAAIPAIAFNSSGTRLAIAVSYNWDEGAEGARAALAAGHTPQIWIREIGDEIKVRDYFCCILLTRLLTHRLRVAEGLDRVKTYHCRFLLYIRTYSAFNVLSLVFAFFSYPTKTN